MSAEVQVNIVGIKEAERALSEFPKRVPGAVASSINRAITAIGADINKQVRAEYHIKAKDVRGTLTRTRATRAQLHGKIQSTGRPIPLDRFKVSPKTVQPKRKSQLKISVKKGNVKQVTGAFVADINGIKIFKRTGKRRLPIKRLYGPSVPQMIGSPMLVSAVESRGQEVFRTRMTHEVGRILSRLRA